MAGGIFDRGEAPSKEMLQKRREGEEKRREEEGRKKEGGEPRESNQKCKAIFTNFALVILLLRLLCKTSIKNLGIK